LKIKWRTLIISLLIPLGIGGLAAFLTRDSMQTFESLNQPPLSPPGWLFPVGWTILYILMGIDCYIVYNSDILQMLPIAGMESADILPFY